MHQIAVECKLLDTNSPLIVLGSTENNLNAWQSPVYSPGGNHTDLVSFYRPSEFVGRSMEHIFQKNKNNKNATAEWDLRDSEIFVKMSQAISSASDMVRNKLALPMPGVSETFVEVTPVLVVPDDTLWSVSFNNVGDIQGEPKQEVAVRYFIEHSCEEQRTRRTERTVNLVHMTICTAGSLISSLQSSELFTLEQDYYLNSSHKPVTRIS